MSNKNWVSTPLGVISSEAVSPFSSFTHAVLSSSIVASYSILCSDRIFTSFPIDIGELPVKSILWFASCSHRKGLEILDKELSKFGVALRERLDEVAKILKEDWLWEARDLLWSSWWAWRSSLISLLFCTLNSSCHSFRASNFQSWVLMRPAWSNCCLIQKK